MCMGATCGTCSKRTWRGCGKHISSAMDGISEDEWCTCTPRVKVGEKDYPPAASFQVPGLSWLTGGSK
ncbi:hypothetical protein HYQ45_002897 [Verticillium longisporum]|nr:uncharacterized protein D7B24_008353 [Verticillium nonalfalfae]KAF3353238.1 hypothetical protein VdG1_04597 [Verticillium dahliae VDG1]KAG7124044.1 hypothetical protein HYQ44_002680 [Verticillium longisporum]KAG7126661.1 hypothetical protein HYQ44_000381 [Verticillium longisporum]KAG7140195.1 hypothetical protein HYQ45_002897 [Verticillium longisporum]KAG7150885.1 hypothetical protein HYQ46_000156 [Verticillium longisporum]